MKNPLFVIIAVVALAIGGAMWYGQDVVQVEGEKSSVATKENSRNCPDFSEDTLQVNGEEFNVGIADTPDKRALGLGGCPELQNNEGLLFTFENPKKTAFWMKDMVMPIDIIWIAGEKVVGIEHNVQPPEDVADKDLPTYTSPQEVDSVLEIAAQESKKRGIEVGSEISF